MLATRFSINQLSATAVSLELGRAVSFPQESSLDRRTSIDFAVSPAVRRKWCVFKVNQFLAQRPQQHQIELRGPCKITEGRRDTLPVYINPPPPPPNYQHHSEKATMQSNRGTTGHHKYADPPPLSLNQRRQRCKVTER